MRVSHCRAAASRVATFAAATAMSVVCASCCLIEWAVPSLANPYGVEPLLKSSFEKVDLEGLLDPLNYASGLPNKPTGTTPADAERNLNRAIVAFHSKYDTSRDGLRRRRDGVQERMLFASNQAAAQFEKYLKRYDATTNFSLGAITTALAGLGSIFTPASTVRALSGSAAITSGVRAEWNETFFNNLTIQLLVNGMKSRREQIYAALVKRRTDKSVDDYTIEEAIKDAIAYHSAFSLVVGLEESGLALERARNPGLAELDRILNQSKVIQRGLGITPEMVGQSFDGVEIVNDLDAALAAFQDQKDQAASGREQLSRSIPAILALDRTPTIGAVLAPVTEAESEFDRALADLNAAIDAVRTAVAAKASEAPSAESLRHAIAILSLKLGQTSGEPRKAVQQQLEIQKSDLRTKILRLTEIADVQAGDVTTKLTAVQTKREATLKAAQAALLALKVTFVQRRRARVAELTTEIDAWRATPPTPAGVGDTGTEIATLLQETEQVRIASEALPISHAALGDVIPSLVDSIRALKQRYDDAKPGA